MGYRKGCTMVETKKWDESYGEVIELEQGGLDWLHEVFTPELATLAVGGLLTICACGVVGGRNVSLKLGPLMLDIA